MLLLASRQQVFKKSFHKTGVIKESTFHGIQLLELMLAATPANHFSIYRKTQAGYIDFLTIRIAHSEAFVNEAKHARESALISG